MYRLIVGKSPVILYLLLVIVAISFGILHGVLDDETNNILLNNRLITVVLQLFLVLLTAVYLRERCAKMKLVSNTDGSLAFLIGIALLALPIGKDSIYLLMSTCLAVMVMNQLSALYNKQTNPVSEFEIGILVALAIFIHSFFLFLFLLAFIGIVTMKAVTWRNIIAYLLGAVLVFVVQAVYYWYFIDLPSFVESHHYTFELISIAGVKRRVAIILVGLASLLVPLQYNRSYSDQMNIKERLTNRLWFYFFLFMFISIVLFRPGRLMIATLVLLSVPLFVLAEPFWKKKKKKWINDLILLMFYGPLAAYWLL